MAYPDCKIPATHDKFDETHYFLHGMLREFHEPDEFRWNLNANLQALRSISNIANSEMQARPGFAGWWPGALRGLRDDALLSRFSKGRDLVVHREMLITRSRVEAGIFRGPKLKLAMQFDQPAAVASDVLLHRLIELWTGKMIDVEHSAIGEQLGVRRVWIVPALAEDEDVVVACHRAWAKVSEFVVSAHDLVGSQLPVIPDDPRQHDPARWNLLTESDLDPSLPAKWGWE